MCKIQSGLRLANFIISKGTNGDDSSDFYTIRLKNLIKIMVVIVVFTSMIFKHSIMVMESQKLQIRVNTWCNLFVKPNYRTLFYLFYFHSCAPVKLINSSSLLIFVLNEILIHFFTFFLLKIYIPNITIHI